MTIAGQTNPTGQTAGHNPVENETIPDGWRQCRLEELEGDEVTIQTMRGNTFTGILSYRPELNALTIGETIVFTMDRSGFPTQDPGIRSVRPAGPAADNARIDATRRQLESLRGTLIQAGKQLHDIDARMLHAGEREAADRALRETLTHVSAMIARRSAER